MERTRTAIATAALGLTLGAGLPAVVPAASYAERVTITDDLRDPVRIQDIDDDGEPDTTPAPGARALDIESTRFTYRTGALVVRARTAVATKRVSPRVRVLGGGEDRDFGADDQGRVFQFDRGGSQRCRGGEASFNREKGVYRIEIPARCFGSPASLRAGYRLDRYDGRGSGSTILDDAVLGGDGGLYYEIGLGPRLRRG